MALGATLISVGTGYLTRGGYDETKVRAGGGGDVRAGGGGFCAGILRRKTKGAPKSAASRLVVMPACDLKWTDLDPTGAPGVRIADPWGDHTKGAYGAFFKLPAGFAVPLHTHTHDIKVVIVVGDLHSSPGGKA